MTFHLPPIPYLALLFEPLRFLLRLLGLLSPIQHFWPHPASPAEGYYTRLFNPTTKSTLLVIISSVRNAKDKPHYIHFSLHRPGHPQLTIHHHPEFVPSTTLPVRADGVFYEPDVGIKLDLPEHGLNVEVSFDGDSRLPWVRGDALSSPEGYAFSELVHMSPLHWNVYSRRTQASYRVMGADGEVIDEGAGLAHVEKNWGWEFPSRWMWIQGFLGKGQKVGDEEEEGVVVAGGGLAGLTVYMVCLGRWAFWPAPWPLSQVAWENGGDVWRLRVWKGWWQKGELVVKDGGEKLLLRCPMRDGHGNFNAEEAFQATAEVKVWEREWWKVGAWKLAKRWEMEDVALEFGGEYLALRKRQ